MSIITVGVFIAVSFGQESKESPAHGTRPPFSCEILQPEEPAQPEITGREGGVDFELYYVERSCGWHTYEFIRDSITLYVTHSVENLDDCDILENVLFGARGNIENLEPGTYMFVLRIGDRQRTQDVFREMVKVP
jgi:hypothetical protein